MSWCTQTDLGVIDRSSTDDDLRARILSRVSKNEAGCWEWLSTMTGDGYGKVVVAWRMNGQPVRRLAHRVMFELAAGHVQPGLDIDHLCRNRRCCNPDHLEPVTRKVNVARGALPGMMREKAATQTTCARGHDLIGDNLGLQGPDRKARYCKRCSAEKQNRNYHANKEAINERRRRLYNQGARS